MKIKVLELFAGSRSFSNVAESMGAEVLCTEIFMSYINCRIK